MAFRVFRNLEDASADFGPSALTIGNFDGVHAGHRHLLRQVVEVAEKIGAKPSVMTFDPHPTRVVAPARSPRLITTPDQRCSLMKEEGIEQVLILPFNYEFSQLSAEDFVEKVLVQKLGARAVLVGENFRFGHQHAGDTAQLGKLGRRFGFKTQIIPGVMLRGQIVSSSAVRQLIEAGRVSRAGRLLERPFTLEGEVVAGRGVGSKQTVPTLNLAPSSDVLPATGVYVTRTRDLESDGSWPSVTNVGYRPTFGGRDLSVETFLLAPLEGASPKRIAVEFCLRLREERKFETPEKLKAQILRDAARAQEYFHRVREWTRGPLVSHN
jgi:riboflavin kinase/FMN adenylyltransferase